jgi:hypothetical protein
MSSKAALSVLSKAVTWSDKVPLVLHMDSTYKLNVNEYPVLILAISDAQQQFCMLSISVISHHSESIYKDLPTHFQRLLLHFFPDIRFTPEYVMTDCDVVERYVFYVTSFTINNVFHSLFCIFLHVIMLLIVSYVAP